MLDTFWHDVRYALRTLAKSPGFAAVAVLTLALGIGANTAIFSVIYGVMFRPLPYRDSDRIEQVVRSYRGAVEDTSFTYSEFRFLKEHSVWCDALAAFTANGFNIVTENGAERVNGLHVSAGFLRVLGVSPMLGRDFLAEEDRGDGARAVIISYGLWKRRFGGDPSAVGRSISLDGRNYTIIGVMPSGFAAGSPLDFGVPPELSTGSVVDVWAPMALVAKTAGSGQNLSVFGRRASGVNHSQAVSAADALTEPYRASLPYPVSPELRLTLYPFRKMIASDISTPLMVLLGAVSLVLLIACVNVANLLLARVASRAKEIAVRTALGASRWRLIRQLLTESVVLSALGALLGILLAQWGLNSLLILGGHLIPRVSDIHLDRMALGFTAGLSLLASLLFGIAPALQAERLNLSGVFRGGSGRATSGSRGTKFLSALVVCEFALALVLLVGAALLMETFGNLLRVNPGFDAHKILTAEMWLTGSRYKSTPELAAYYDRLLDRIRALPGVENAAIVSADAPFRRAGNLPIAVDEKPLNDAVGYHVVTPDYFHTLGVAVRQGRSFVQADTQRSEPVAIVNEAFVRAYLGSHNPLSVFVKLGNSEPPRRAVGVIGDVKSYVGEAAPPTVFVSAAQASFGITMLFDTWFPTHLLVRTSGDPMRLAKAVEAALREEDAQIPAGRIRSMGQLLSSSLVVQRLLAVLLGAFAGLALMLSAVGIYGVVAQSVVQRTQEIGIRMALGARPRDVLRHVVAHNARLALLGVGIGTMAALLLTHALASLLFGVTPKDPVTFIGAAALLTAVALLACYLPARRATRIDPLVALRYE